MNWQAHRRVLVLVALSAMAFNGQTSNMLASAANSQQADWKVWVAHGQQQLTEEDFAEAESDFRKALAEISKSKHSVDEESHCLRLLADTLTLRDQTGEAGKYYQKSLTLLQSKYGANSPQIVQPLFSMGAMYESAGNHSAAMNYYQRAMQINEKHYGPYSPAVANSLHRMGKASLAAGDRSQAEKHYKESLAILMKEPSLSSSDQMQKLLSDYQDLLKKDNSESSDLLSDYKKDILQNNAKETNSKPTTSTTSTVNKSAVPTSGAATTPVAGTTSSGSAKDSLEKRILTSDKNSKDFNAPDTVAGSTVPDTEFKLRPPVSSTSDSAVKNPAILGGPSSADSAANSQFNKESSFQLNALRQQQTNEEPMILSRGFAQPLMQNTLNPAFSTVDDAINRQNRYQDSEQFHQRKIAIDIQSLGGSHPSVGNDLNSLALLYISKQRYREAEPLLMRAIKIYENVYGSNNVLVMKTRATLASVEYYMGNTEQAAQMYRTALGDGISEMGMNNVQTARILNELAYLYYQQGKLQEASNFYEWALSSTKGAVGEKSPLTAACMRDYALVLRGLGRQSEATEMNSKADLILAQN